MKNPINLPIKNRVAKYCLEKITRLDGVKAIYQSWLDNPNNQHGTDGHGLLTHGLNYLDVKLNIHNPQNLASVAQTGAVIFVCNHPLGGLDGMLLAQMLLKIRPDLKVLTNELLLNFPEFSDLFIGVDVLNPHQQMKNTKGILQLSKHLAQGGAVLIFPAGIVAKIAIKNFSIQEQAWSPMLARLIKKYHADCLPMYLDTRNSYLFYLSGLIHKRLRTALLGRAMLAQKQQKIDVIIGHLVPAEEIQHTEDKTAVTEYLKLCCLSLKPNVADKTKTSNQLKLQAIKQDIDLGNIQSQLQKLAPYCLLEHQSISVYCAPYAQLGCIMEQISISREKTFRAVDEGTGKELDSDMYDPFYWHLWAWDYEKNLIVGGYRMAKVDELLHKNGLKNLYSHSLYHYDRGFIKSLENCVEVGRSFVTPQYQKHPRALDLLWKGIGAYMLNNPQYHTLFGCVSISRQYSNLARAFLADTLIYHYSAQASIAQKVLPRKPLTLQDKPWSQDLLPSLAKIPIINKLLGKIDSGKSIPVLIRHYLGLNGKFITFSVNESFNHSLDGLILVDLRLTPDKYLNRYMGTQGAIEFKKRWHMHENVA